MREFLFWKEGNGWVWGYESDRMLIVVKGPFPSWDALMAAWGEKLEADRPKPVEAQFETTYRLSVP